VCPATAASPIPGAGRSQARAAKDLLSLINRLRWAGPAGCTASGWARSDAANRASPHWGYESSARAPGSVRRARRRTWSAAGVRAALFGRVACLYGAFRRTCCCCGDRVPRRAGPYSLRNCVFRAAVMAQRGLCASDNFAARPNAGPGPECNPWPGALRGLSQCRATASARSQTNLRVYWRADRVESDAGAHCRLHRRSFRFHPGSGVSSRSAPAAKCDRQRRATRSAASRTAKR